MRIGLATVPVPSTIDRAVETILDYIAQAASFGVELLCFPAAYLPGLRGRKFRIPLCEQDQIRAARETVRRRAAQHAIAVILPLEWPTDKGLYNMVQVISPSGGIIGTQCKTQLDPGEEDIYVPGKGRRIFDLKGVSFGVVICDEGWKYPETVRWAARRGASIVFHPQCTGSNATGHTPRHWCDPDAPFYEKAMVCRSVENGVYFASVNYALACQESATSVIGPDGACLAHQPYGQPGLLIQQLELELADTRTADRYAPERY
jgi:predicted amidohydrolase